MTAVNYVERKSGWDTRLLSWIEAVFWFFCVGRERGLVDCQAKLLGPRAIHPGIEIEMAAHHRYIAGFHRDQHLSRLSLEVTALSRGLDANALPERHLSRDLARGTFGLWIVPGGIGIHLAPDSD